MTMKKNNRPIISTARRTTLPAFSSSIHHQSGAVLIISLIMLLLLTLIGVTASQVTTLEEKMAGNMRDKNLAFQAAESVLREAENRLKPDSANPASAFDNAGTNGLYSQTSTIPAEAAIMTDVFWTNNPVETSGIGDLGNGIAPPQYIIQRLPAACFTLPCSGHLSTPYKITVRATGSSPTTVVILQSIFTAG